MATNVIEDIFVPARLKHSSRVPKYSGIMEMAVDDWSRIEDNPRQRDTEGRAARAKHLRELHPTHSKVNMARLPDGNLYKLDGHTRGYLWAKGSLEAPAKLYVDVWDCLTIDEAKNLYGTFDSKSAVETVTDQVFGAVRDGKVQFESELLKSQRFAGAMRFASALLSGKAGQEQSVYDLFEYWLPELKLLDTCMPTRKRFHTGVAIAALLTLRRHGPRAIPFWKTFAIGGGIKMGGEMDAVQALEERMESLRCQRQLTGSGNNTKVARICLSAFDAYENDQNYVVKGGGIKALQDNSFNKWIDIANRTKRGW